MPSVLGGKSNKELEDQNARLTEVQITIARNVLHATYSAVVKALVRLRDYTEELKAELDSAVTSTDASKAANQGLETTSKALQEAQAQIATLKEELDAAHNAETIVERLSQKNMALEEEVARLTEVSNKR